VVGNQLAHFTPRQAEIVVLIGMGLSDKEIARELHLSRRTVRTHLERLYAEHDLHNRTAAALLWFHGDHPKSASPPSLALAPRL
jgi:DNA-binding NarL/FixJ family response regulator